MYMFITRSMARASRSRTEITLSTVAELLLGADMSEGSVIGSQLGAKF